METETINHYSKLGIDIDKETVLFTFADNEYNFEFDDESILYRGEKNLNMPVGFFLLEFANMRSKSGGDYKVLKQNLEKLNTIYKYRGREHFIAMFNMFHETYSVITALILTLEYYGFCDETTGYMSHIDGILLLIELVSSECSYYINKGELSSLKPNASLTAHFVPCKDSNSFDLLYETISLLSFVMMDVYQSEKNNIKPKRCALCGKAFLPASRSDEIYCRNIYQNGRTCSQMAFSVKSKNNPFYSEYRKAYKTMKARVSRAGGNKILQEKTKRWSIEALAKLIEYEQLGDINEYREWIEQSKKN